MPARCTVCDHPQRDEIDKELATGAYAKRRIAARHGLVEGSIRRHEARHLPESLIVAVRASQVASASSLLDRVDRMAARLERLAEKCDAYGTSEDVLKLTRELRPSLELFGKVSGEIASNQVNALFIELGVRDQSEIRSALDLTRSTRELSPEACIEEGIDLVRMALQKRPDLRMNVQRRIEELSGAVVLEDTNGVPHE